MNDAATLNDRPVYWAIGPGNWGKGLSEVEAIANLKKQGMGDRYLIYLTTTGTTFYNDGSFGHPMDDPEPLLTKRVRKMNGRWKTELVEG